MEVAEGPFGHRVTQLHHPDDEGLPTSWSGMYGNAVVQQHKTPGVVLSSGEKILFDGTRMPLAPPTQIEDVL
jgi:hypothetical protein